MRIAAFLTAVVLMTLAPLDRAKAASVLNCSGTTIRVLSLRRDSLPGTDGLVLRDGKRGELAVFGSGTMVKIFEVGLFDVLRVSAVDPKPEARLAVTNGGDGRWRLTPQDIC